ncbi:TonB-dependent receptor [Biformimicrobium ophioploci]|uniref:TonB-dependent receptor n=1 Tax=Biformimicrobium ophioploci TaxID=3036711 RepID=A0ABQ6M0H0_9GAMM|nr:TonB-dependent receptor [Microbulbifer sp. NKW57]GMG87816.1 TonB-dependent receptor [Microbulbifer sp. NKW57]
MENKRKLGFSKTALAQAVAAVSAGYVLAMPAAFAQEEEMMMEEIIVTATSREASIQDIPYNISAVSGDDIEAKNIVNSNELLRSVAGVAILDRGYRNGGMTNNMIIRGLNVDNGANGDIGLSTVSPVATYVDATPIFANFVLKDVERVEVLRGPQGTLYGSGAMGGTVRYIMNKPDSSEFDAKISTSLSQTDGSDGQNFSGDVMLNMPLSDNAAVRVSAGKIDNAGVVDYVNLYELQDGKPVVAADDGSCRSVQDGSLSAEELVFNGSCYTSKDDADTVEIEHARAALKLDLGENVSVLASYQMQRDEVGSRRSVTEGADYLGNAYGDYENGSTMLEASERDVDLMSLEVEADLGFATLTSTTSSYEHSGNGWRDNTSLWVTDRGGFANWFDILYPGTPRPVAHVNAGYEEEAFVQELRLVSNSGDSNIDWVAGAYYMDQDRTTTNVSYLLGLDEYAAACLEVGAACPADGEWFTFFDLQETDFDYNRKETFEDLAVYGELTFHVSEDVHITGGVRWFDNKLTNNTALGFPLIAGDSVDFEEFAPQEEDDIQYKLNASWDISDSTMAYATYSEGFRRGGSNAVPCSGFFFEPNCEVAGVYGKDTAQNYELGVKGSSERMRYSANLFVVDWKDPQLNTATAWWGFFMAQNGASARTNGLEVEAEFALTDSTELHAGYTYTEAELTDDVINVQVGGVIAEDGSRLPGIPENVLTLSLTHSRDLANGIEMVARLGSFYQSDTINSVVDNTLQQKHDGFSIWNASANFVKDSWVISLYGKNLMNEEGVTGAYPSAYMGTDTGTFENYYGNNARQYISTPRTFGLSASYNF